MKTKARTYAVKKHGEQKYGDEPYFVHLDQVAAIAGAYGELAAVIAYLHDVVEDTDTTVEEIESEFGVLVANCVSILTDEPGANRKERKSKTYEKMARVGEDLELALLVKAADRLANLRACVQGGNDGLLRMYRGEHNVFKSSVYRPDLCESLWEEMEKIVHSR